MTIWKGALPVFRISRCRPSLLKVMPTVRHTRTPVSTPRSSPADMSTGSSRAAWGITCRRKHLKSSPQPSSPSPSKADRHLHPLKEHTMSTLEGESDGLPAGKLLYTAKVHTTGGRERGVARSCDGNLDIRLSTPGAGGSGRSEEHTSELQSLMRISYAVFCLKKKTTKSTKH